ncbi:hypothetical protein AMS69_02980 [Haloarcula rubripromontorii]|uniref:Uncharacterized protein n=1 Tax=Haloarcula rubripromontorii TaxID=1705562 RepID=A0A0N0UA09_9EURY|nr:hypothetical protein [Haloarcula rubripromontorii]KOX94840.1 hypothetical protein AMS69_02980 [Haloarcula rubripromontorii]
MRETTRRGLLATCGAGLVGLTGCSGLSPFGEREERVDTGRLDGDLATVALPGSPYPISVPASLGERHRKRGRELLDGVPDSPSIPNAAVAQKLREERDRAGDSLEADSDREAWPLDRLDSYRYDRSKAASVRSAYRAATGKDDGDRLREYRRTVATTRSTFAGELAYRANGPVAAVLAHEPLEGLLAECREELQPMPPYPDDPRAEPFRAGDAVGTVERSAAALADARRLHERYLRAASDPTPQWDQVAVAAESLERTLRFSQDRVEGYREPDAEVFERDLEGTTARQLYTDAARDLRIRTEETEAAVDDADFAAAVLNAARGLVALEVLTAVVTGIQEGEYQGDVSLSTVRSGAKASAAAIESALDTEPRGLAVRLCEPALFTHRSAVRSVSRYDPNAPDLLAEFRQAELLASAVPEATAFVVERLQVGDATRRDK